MVHSMDLMCVSCTLGCALFYSGLLAHNASAIVGIYIQISNLFDRAFESLKLPFIYLWLI
jgi:hypothetical protein